MVIKPNSSLWSTSLKTHGQREKNVTQQSREFRETERRNKRERPGSLVSGGLEGTEN